MPAPLLAPYFCWSKKYKFICQPEFVELVGVGEAEKPKQMPTFGCCK